MKKFILLLIFLNFTTLLKAQQNGYPIYKGCENLDNRSLKSCFNENLKKDVVSLFRTPENVLKDDYRGSDTVIFLVTKAGRFQVLYVNSPYQEIKDEIKRVFENLPKIKAVTFNGRAIDTRFGMPLKFPIQDNNSQDVEIAQSSPQIAKTNDSFLKNHISKDNIQPLIKKQFPEHQSQLNIPFTHSSYDDLEYYYDNNDNTHTGFKPYQYNEANKYVDLDAQKLSLFKKKKTWAGRKFWNEHFISFQANDYWFTINPVLDLQIGKDDSSVNDYTYNNTRAIQIQGGLGKKFNFSTSFYESQGKFADYVNDYARTNKPNNNSFGLVPGRGRAKKFKDNGFDYPIAEAYLSYTPNNYFNFQFGHGKNFIGDGYRSFMLSDVASPYPYLKISTQFWKIKYTNLWMFLDDVRPEVSANGISSRKFVSLHHLSWNVNKKLNIGLFEAVVSSNENKTGLDVNFFNPIIFLRALEFTRGTGGGNALLGLSTKYKLTKNISTYSQFVLDELTVGRFFNGDGYWGNKFAFQFGAKFYNAFKVDHLYLQSEINLSRPYTFAHENPILNYGHFNQPIGHLWGSNFWEFIGIARYKKNRWFANAKFNIGQKGLDNNGLNYGGNIYLSNNDRIANTGNELLQGIKTNIFIADFQGGYIVNPSTNLQFFGGLIFRDFNPTMETTDLTREKTTWFTIGLRTDIFNWYFDF
jgi:hypothetical protein